MLDIKDLILNKDNYINDLKKRNIDYSNEISKIIQLQKLRITFLNEIDSILAKKNSFGREISEKKQKNINIDLTSINKETNILNEKLKILKDKLDLTEKDINNYLLIIPNVPHGTVPVGKDEKSNKVLSTWKEIPKFIFTPKNHWDLLKINDMIDFDAATKITGTRYALFKNKGAELIRILANKFLDHNISNGFFEIKPGCVINYNSLKNTGQLPKFEDDLFKINENTFLSPTSEVQLINIYSNSILNEEQLPIRNTSYTSCFRKEAGSAGKDTRGIIRLHEFNKVEIISVCSINQWESEFNLMIENVSNLLKKLNLPFRIVYLSTGDMGFSSKKTYDFEVWFPGQNCYKEVSSCSFCGDFQSRRSLIKYKNKNNIKNYCYTLNGSSLAIERIIASLLENNQNKDGTINWDFLKKI